MKTKKISRANKKKKSADHQMVAICEANAAGIDIGAKEIYVAVPPDRAPQQPVRCYGTFTADLISAIGWLKECGIESVAMESTGVYWVGLYQLLNDHGLKVCLVNARHVKNVPGRKSDVSDSQWLQYLHSVGLLRGSYRPPQAICALRSLYRHRQNLLQFGAQHIQHMQAAMEQMNLKLAHVIDDITGLTGMRIIEAILSGERDREQLAKLRDRRVKASQATVAKALQGDWRAEHLFVLEQALSSWKQVQQQIAQCDGELQKLAQELESKVDLSQTPLAPSTKPNAKSKAKNEPTGPWREEQYRIFGVDLTAVPAINVATVQTLLVEVGPDWSAFKTAAHFSSWLGLCPDNKITGGKVFRRSTRRIAHRVSTALRLAASSLHKSQSLFGQRYRRLRSRLGAPKAITAMAHQLARVLWHLVTYKTPYDESLFARAEEAHSAFKTRQLKNLADSLGFALVPKTSNATV
jgi:transposase